MERRIPIISSGKAMVVAHGFPDYPFAVMPHPINATTCEMLDSRVEDALPEIVRLLLHEDSFFLCARTFGWRSIAL